ncbi:hypothetical protein RCL1_000622 [Eukaryota sp. TZLM3-RCL]
MSSFVSESNPCGQTLLRLVSRSSAIVAELLRLAQNIPDVFTLSTKSDKQKYGAIILDFNYLDQPEQFEYKIKQDPDLLDLDEEFPQTHMQLLERFYKLFESIIKYHSDFCLFLNQLQTGVFIQHTLAGVLSDIEGRQLLSEGITMFATILLLLDMHLPGIIRERLVISYYRYKGAAELPHFDDVTKLCRQTGFIPDYADKYGFLTVCPISKGKRVKNYPEELFSRFRFDCEIISMLLGRLRSDDIYHRLEAYPSPDHRSVALSLQASQIFLLLFFDPEVLRSQEATMREIVDKHFSDNWIISFYLGHLVDLTVAWEPYKAARNALQNTVSTASVRSLASKHLITLSNCHKKTLEYLVDGVLTEDFVLTNSETLISLVRATNVSLKFLLTHTVPSMSNQKYLSIMTSLVSLDDVLTCLLSTADLEFKLKSIIETALQAKSQRWSQYQEIASTRMHELAEYFAGDAALSRRSKDHNLQQWCTRLSSEIKGISLSDSVVAGRQIASLINALEEVEQFHQIDSSLHVKQFVGDTRDSLAQMLRVVNLSEKTLLFFTLASDFAYAWRFLPHFTAKMQQRVRKDPRVVLQLRALFLKAASILEVPLVRIQQANSADLASVANYYSTNLVSFVRKVLQVVPKTMFELFYAIIELISVKITPLPVKIPRDDLPNFAQLELRNQLSQKTHEISLLAEGVLAMQTTLVGIIELDPKQLLEDGIEAELVVKLSHLLDDVMVFKKKDSLEFSQQFEVLLTNTTALKQALEYIQDYISIYGLKVWQKVLSRIICYNVEQECNQFLKDKIYSWDSKYQSEVAPIPKLTPKDSSSETFVGRIVSVLIEILNGKKVYYNSDLMGFVKLQSNNVEVLNQTTVLTMYKVLGAYGLEGLDRMFSFLIVKDLRVLYKEFNRLSKNKLIRIVAFSESVQSVIDGTSAVSDSKFYTNFVKKMESLVELFLLKCVSIGQSQLIRTAFQSQLNLLAGIDAFSLTRTLSTTNQSLIDQIRAHSRDPESVPYPEQNHLLDELSKMIDSVGFDDPFLKLYSVSPSSLDGLNVAFILFLGLISMNNTLIEEFNGSPDLLRPVLNVGDFDFNVLFTGFVSISRQFSVTTIHTLASYLATYVKSMFSLRETDAALSMISVLRKLIDLKLFTHSHFVPHLDLNLLKL